MGIRCSRPRRIIQHVIRATVAGVALTIVSTGSTDATESDLSTGLAYLRAGAQSQAGEYLARYRDSSRDPAVRERISRVLPLLKQPLPKDVRDYLAMTIEEGVAGRELRTSWVRPPYWFRSFPVFP